MNILDNATRNFSGQGLLSIEVPEWGDENSPAVIYFRPVTCRESEAIEQARRKSSAKALIESAMLKFLDENGKPLFDRKEQMKIEEAIDFNVLNEAVSKMGEVLREARAEYLGKFNQTTVPGGNTLSD